MSCITWELDQTPNEYIVLIILQKIIEQIHDQ